MYGLGQLYSIPVSQLAMTVLFQSNANCLFTLVCLLLPPQGVGYLQEPSRPLGAEPQQSYDNLQLLRSCHPRIYCKENDVVFIDQNQVSALSSGSPGEPSPLSKAQGQHGQQQCWLQRADPWPPHTHPSFLQRGEPVVQQP